MRDRLLELISYFGDGYQMENKRLYETKVTDIADYLLANGVLVIDTDVVSAPNRPLITQCMGRPIDEIINLIRASEWISVEDRLPDKEGTYLTYTDKDNVDLDIFCIYPSHGTKFWSGEIKGKVTHWMPLPEAPKMKGGAE